MKKVLSSPLVSAANNIVSIGNASKRALPRFQRDFNDFNSFLQIKTIELERIKLPQKRKIRELANINLASSFGRPGGLLGGLFSGAFDVAQFLGDMFPSRGKMGKPQPNSGTKPPKPTVKGSKLKFGGLRSIGILNAVFAGVDFATGLKEGESVGKAAAGAGGALAGSLLGGAIGQALIPIPGLGFVVGSAAGGFLGGWGADRITEVATGGKGGVSEKISQRLKGEEKKQKESVQQTDFSNTIKLFDSSVSKFEDFVYKSFASMVNGAAAASGSDEKLMDYGLDPDSPPDSPILPGELQDMTAEGGQLPSKYTSSPYGWRWGKLHSGVDYATTEGTPVSAIQPGQVSYAGWDDGGYGKMIMISHPGGNTTLYGHMSKINVKTGQTIEPGTVIGNVGTTGRSTGPHVHFEVRQGSKRLAIPTTEGDKYFRFGGNVKIKSGSSGKPTAVLMAGTNDYGDPKSGAAGVKQAIKALQDKGYSVVVVPPSEVGQTSAVSKAVQQAAADMGATIKKGQYKQKDNTGTIPYAHLTDASAKEIASQYKGATFVGDSNAQMIPGAKIADAGARASSIAQQISSLSSIKPKPGIGGDEITAESMDLYRKGIIEQNIQYYPSYNQQVASTTVMPILMGSQGGQQKPVVIPVGGGGQGSTIIIPAPSQGDIVNSLMKTFLLTNLSAT